MVIDGISIEGFKLVVELNTKPFIQYDTHAKLLAAVDDPKFVSESGETLVHVQAVRHATRRRPRSAS